MKLKALEYFASLIEYYFTDDSGDKREIILLKTKAYLALEKCKEELTDNLSLIEAKDGKRYLIVDYIKRFKTASQIELVHHHIFKDYIAYSVGEDLPYYINSDNKEILVAGDEGAAIIIVDLLYKIFGSIKEKCVIEEIDYYDICHKIGFDPTSFYDKTYDERLNSYYIKNGNMKKTLELEFISQLSEIELCENQFWKGLPMKQVIKHFLVMTKRKSKNGEVFLTEDQLVSFLKKGFLGDENQPIQIINCANGQKGFVITRFYELFDLAVSNYGHKRIKKPFINLLSNCFENWEPNTIEAFFKPNKTKETWE